MWVAALWGHAGLNVLKATICGFSLQARQCRFQLDQDQQHVLGSGQDSFGWWMEVGAGLQQYSEQHGLQQEHHH